MTTVLAATSTAACSTQNTQDLYVDENQGTSRKFLFHLMQLPTWPTNKVYQTFQILQMATGMPFSISDSEKESWGNAGALHISQCAYTGQQTDDDPRHHQKLHQQSSHPCHVSP